jgi:two-component system sensor histidine kinase KdpD
MFVTTSREDLAQRTRIGPPTITHALVGQLGITLLLVAAATLAAFIVEHLISAPNLTLVFVLPVVVAATFFGWTPALVAAAVGVLAFDFFFTQPYYSFRMSSPSDLWAASLLLLTGGIVSAVAAESRRRAADSRRAAERAEALQNMAQSVIEGRPRREVVRTGAETLRRMFKAPAVVLVEEAGVLAPHPAGKAELSQAALDAATGALASGVHIRGDIYPYDQSPFDFWPITPANGPRMVLGVDFSHGEEDRPRSPEQFVDVVAGYLTAAPAARA